jgi:hypothetical protein
VFGRGYLLLIDPIVFSVIRDARQREALIWHEVGHLHHASSQSGWWLDILFNVWGVQVKGILFDPLRVELSADTYATKKMNDAEPLLGALRELEKIGWGSMPSRSSSFWDDLLGLVKIMIGLETFWYVHPHLTVRITELENAR